MTSRLNRRQLAGAGAAGLLGWSLAHTDGGAEPLESAASSHDLRIRRLSVTPIALPDPPLLAAGGCHGPYFLRNIVEIETHGGIVGVGETHGGELITAQLEKAGDVVAGRSVFAWRSFAAPLAAAEPSVYAGIEAACLDAAGKSAGRSVCELLGGPVRDQVEFAAYLFYRYAADHARVLDDPRLVDSRGRGSRALDDWGEVRSPEAMAEMAWQFHQRWGFRVMKLKAGVLNPDVERDTLAAIDQRFGGSAPLRVDPNGRWSIATALRIGRQLDTLPLEYYEDPVRGLRAMADVRHETGLKMATNSCVSRFHHVADAVGAKSVDIVLGDLHWFGGVSGMQALGTLAETLGWQLGQHSNNHAGVTMAAMVHAAAATPQLALASDTHYVWLPDEADIIAGGKLPIRRGKMTPPPGPGLGVELDRDRLARAHEVYNQCGMRRRDDRATMQRFEPGWQPTLL